MAIVDLGSHSIPARRAGIGVLVLFLAGIAVWALAYFSGLFPWLGYAWLKRDSFGAGPIAIVGEDRAGTTLGISHFIFFEGQEIVIDYSATIRAGSLWFYVFDIAKSGQGAGQGHYVTSSGTGIWTYRVPRTGLYTISIGPSVVQGSGRGFDMSYSVRWGARWTH
jgi:hypothetical protein